MWRNLFILYFVFVKKQRTIERKKKRSKISALESCYANRIYGTFGVEMRAYGQKLVKFCTQTHRRVNLSSKDNECNLMEILIDTPHWLMRQLGERHGQPWGYISVPRGCLPASWWSPWQRIEILLLHSAMFAICK